MRQKRQPKRRLEITPQKDNKKAIEILLKDIRETNNNNKIITERYKTNIILKRYELVNQDREKEKRLLKISKLEKEIQLINTQNINTCTSIYREQARIFTFRNLVKKGEQLEQQLQELENRKNQPNHQ